MNLSKPYKTKLKEKEESSIKKLGLIKDTELRDIVSALPYVKQQDEYEASKVPNAFVCIDARGRLSIFPTEGGWLGMDLEEMLLDIGEGCNGLQGDIAPFCG